MNNKTLPKEDIIEASIWIHYIYQPETYEENGKALQKILNERRKK